ncbi:MAG: hypothetical protein U9O59_00315 [Actinomycetota bacterium]|nr:hypothetical protein [Actinomycetota bacterium]
MDAWLKSHAAKNKGKKIEDDDMLLTLSIKAIKENLNALKELGIKILPGKLRVTGLIPGFFLKRKLKNLIAFKFGRVALSGHANSAKSEMIKISEDFRNLVKDVGTDMKANDYLYRNGFG